MSFTIYYIIGLFVVLVALEIAGKMGSPFPHPSSDDMDDVYLSALVSLVAATIWPMIILLILSVSVVRYIAKKF